MPLIVDRKASQNAPLKLLLHNLLQLMSFDRAAWKAVLCLRRSQGRGSLSSGAGVLYEVSVQPLPDGVRKLIGQNVIREVGLDPPLPLQAGSICHRPGGRRTYPRTLGQVWFLSLGDHLSV